MFSQLFKKTSVIFFAAFFFAKNCFAEVWSGYDFDDKTAVQIEEGNLVREGLIIQFYDFNLDEYHAAKILFIDSVIDGTRIQIKDLDAKKERTLIMNNQ